MLYICVLTSNLFPLNFTEGRQHDFKKYFMICKWRSTTIMYCFSIDLVVLSKSLQDVLTVLQKSIFLILYVGNLKI